MKKLFTIFGLICMINLTFAQEMVTVHQNGHEFQVSAVRSVTDYPASNIQFWVGSGSNSVVAVFKWGQNATMGIAYGYRWDGTATIYDMLTAIAAADSRFTITFNTSTNFIENLSYQDGTYYEYLETAGYCTYTFNGAMSSGVSDALVNNGYFELEEWGDCYPFPANTPIIPATDPNAPTDPVDATIAASDIAYWVGEGSNEAVMAVNWADTALAWGYRWNGTATVEDMMNHIAAADPRFSFTGTGFLNDINYIDTAAGMTTPLGITPGNWWSSTNNGFMDMGMTQTLANGDFEKWADPAAGIIVDSTYDATYQYWWYTYVYPMTITPVTVPDTTGGGTPGPNPGEGPFCGGVGTDGCNAIAANDNVFVAWATGVVLTRGPQMITNPDSPLASHGNETNAIGPATLNNSMDAVSLGDGGSALLTFERPIRNGEGPDFVVFENDNTGGFLELAFVEVSSDGEHFVRFPATSLTPTDEQVGSFGSVDPTFINNLAGKFRIGYGTPFDLEELADSANINLDSIVYVRVIDVVGTIDPQYATYDAFGHIVNDPWPTDFASSGFDLSGVGVIYQKPVGIENHEMPQVFAYPNPCTGTLYIINENAERIELYSMNGQLLEVVNDGDTHVTLNMQSYPAGLYMLKVGNGVQKILKK